MAQSAPQAVLPRSSPSSSIQWTPRTNVSIFIHALHLLNIDLHPDWPGISGSIFTNSKSAQNLQRRTKSTEWALYRLFQLYSPSDTASRLSPHFPPTTPIRSKNLRAGLFKWLTELKSSGALPREVVLRKTMLDECRGEKFEEVLARFGMVVLRKTLQDDEKSGRRSVKKGSKAVEEQDVDYLVPLILARRVSLQRSLQKRQDLEEKATACSDKLAQLRKDIAVGLQELRPQSSSSQDAGQPLSTKEYDTLREQVNLAFANNRRWARYTFEGTTDPSFVDSAHEMPKWPFDNPETGDAQCVPIPVPAENDAGDEVNEPMRQLQSLISRHQERIERLTRLRDSLLTTQSRPAGEIQEPPPNPSRRAMIEETKTPPLANSDVSSLPKLRFNRHQDLTLKL